MYLLNVIYDAFFLGTKQRNKDKYVKYYEIKRRNINDLVPQNYYASGNKTSKRTIRFLANVTARRNCQKPEFDPPRAVNQSINQICVHSTPRWKYEARCTGAIIYFLPRGGERPNYSGKTRNMLMMRELKVRFVHDIKEMF